MKIVKTLTALLATTLALAPCAAALASQSGSATVTHDPEWIGMSLSPIVWNIEGATENTGYDKAFTLSNTGGGVSLGEAVVLDTYLRGSDTVNGTNSWKLTNDVSGDTPTYSISSTIDENSTQQSLSNSELVALIQGLAVGYKQTFSLRLVTPATGVDPNSAVSTTMYAYVVKSPEGLSLAGEQANPAPTVDFAQYPSQISMDGAGVGSSQEFTLYLRNRTAVAKTFYLSAYAVPDDACCDAYSSIPDTSWIKFYHNATEVQSVTIAGNNQREEIQVQVDIPDDTELNGQKFECWIGVTDQAGQQSGINIVPVLCSRLLISTPEEASAGSSDMGKIAGATCGSALLMGVLGWRFRSRRHGKHGKSYEKCLET